VKHIPEWLPGGGFKKIAREWRRVAEETADRPFEFVKDNMVAVSESLSKSHRTDYFQAAGTADVSFTSSLMTEEPLTQEEEFDLKWAAASLYTGAFLTTCLPNTIHPRGVNRWR
jgi:hypothetical protein